MPKRSNSKEWKTSHPLAYGIRKHFKQSFDTSLHLDSNGVLQKSLYTYRSEAMTTPYHKTYAPEMLEN
jgi:hypothetical protein